MQTSPGTSEVLRFGIFELDCRAGELRKRGVRVHLQDQPLQILIMLLERPGEVVTKEEIQARLWPSGAIVEFEHSIGTAIKKLRQALGDDAGTPRYVETLPRRGYRFIAPVENSVLHQPPAVEPAATVGEANLRRPRFTSYTVLGLAALLVIVLAGSWTWRSWRKPSVTAAPRVIHSLAVLPLENLTGDPSQEYFADGMTDALITDLAQVSSLRVISRTSTMRYKGSRKALAEIARELKVEGIVEGTVVRSGRRVRVTSQLIYAPLDQHLWAREYERDLSDIVGLQGEVTHSIASEVRAVLSPQQQARLAAARQVNPEAYDLYLQGQSCLNRGTADGIKKAIEYFEGAVERDPNFALAYTGIAEAYASSSVIGPFPANESFPKAKAAAIRALMLDPLLADAHMALGVEMSNYEFDRPGAQSELLRAIELNPNSAKAHRRYAAYLNSMRRHPEAIAEMTKAVELDPWSLPMNQFLAVAYEIAGDYDRALQQYRRVIEMDPNYGQARLNFADLLRELGRYEESITEFENGEILVGTNPDKAVQHATALRHAFRAGGARGYWKEYLALGLRTINEPDQHWFGRVDVAEAYAKLGDKNKSFAWLEKAYQAREGIPLGMINSDPTFEFLHGDPRYSDLMRRLGLPE